MLVIPAEVKYLLFDFDGTLVDSAPLHYKAFKTSLSKYNLDFQYSEIAGLRTYEALKLIFAKSKLQVSDRELKDIALDKQTTYGQIAQKSIRLLPGVEIFLERARKKFGLAIVSAGSKNNVYNSLYHLGRQNYFNFVITGADVKRSKPDPECFLKAKHLFNCSREEAIIFEDSMNGFNAAIASGINFVDVTKEDFSWESIIFY